jgi:DNA-binding HxlR family transcriptional regulator
MSAVGSYLLSNPYLRPNPDDFKRWAAFILKEMGESTVTLEILGKLTNADDSVLTSVLARLCEDGFIEKVDGGWRLTSWGRRVRHVVA